MTFFWGKRSPSPALHSEDILLVQKIIGACILGYNLISRVMILSGSAKSGKTQLSNVIQALVGQENVTQLRTKFLDERFEIYEFLQTTLLVGVDVSPDFLSCPQASALKALVGGDWLTAEQKYGTGRFKIQGNFSVVITSNAQLNVRIQGDADAWQRRLLIVPFNAVTPKKRIPNFGLELVKMEGAGILNWALQGLDLLLRDVDASGDIVLTQRQQDLISGVLSESDSLRTFLSARIQRSPGSNLTSTEIVDAYTQYCRAKAWKPMPEPQVHTPLEKLMLELYSAVKSHCVQRNGGDLRGFKEVKLATEEQK